MNIHKRIARYFGILAWHAGGHKDHLASGMKLPAGGYVADDARIFFADRIELGPGALVLSHASLICAGMPPYVAPEGRIAIGANSIIREGAMLQTYGGAITIGNDCTINPYCMLQGNGGITIGDNVLVAAHACMFSANHVFADPARPIRTQGETQRGIVIGDDVWIGAGVKILDGVRIGRGAVVAAGAVVNRDVAAYEVCAGVPARRIKSRALP